MASMAIIFDGNAFAAKKKKELIQKTRKLKEVGTTPLLATILTGKDPASQLYVNLKKAAAEEVGIKVEIFGLSQRKGVDYLVRLIKVFNLDPSIHGIMIQLPLPARLKYGKDEIIKAIIPEKDVDGLRPSSPFAHPTARAVLQIIKEAKKRLGKKGKKCCVVGAHGMFGQKIAAYLKENHYQVTGVGQNTKDVEFARKLIGLESTKADILISVTGVPNLIRPNLIKPGAIVIDVGSPKPDVDFAKVVKKASFITPVPGGVGPVTVMCLLENVLSVF
jgi:methylenetetrahydrofolate dehydrogenase (NADP+)/methenyltetrahydrofolate cyclohydrolase